MSVDPGSRVAAVHTGAGLFALPDRGAMRVSGGDRVRWLQGMVTNDVASLVPGAGCHALLLTRQGRIVAELHVLAFSDSFLIEADRSALIAARAHLEKFIIADDVTLVDESEGLARFALEGPRAVAILGHAAADPDWSPPGEHHVVEVPMGGVTVQVAAYGFTRGPGLQLLVPKHEAPVVEEALLAAGGQDLVRGDETLFELLRIEAGTPRHGHEIDESVLPDEAGLGDTVCETKGCYTGQEVVARMRSRERISHRLMGLRIDAEAPPEPRTQILLEERRAGEITSAVHSPRFGVIALGYLRQEQAAPGTRVQVAGAGARVCELPFADARDEAPSGA